MTIEEAAKHGDICIWFNGDDRDGLDIGWFWEVNCGYQSWGSHDYYDDPMKAIESLKTFLETWEGPTRPEFRKDIDMSKFTGNQKWQMYCLERFLNLNEA